MAFILPKSKHGSTRLYALRLAQDQNLGTSQILLHSCLFPTGWLCDSLLVSLFSVSKPSLTPGLVSHPHLSTLFLPQVVQCPLFPFPSQWPPRASSLPSFSPSLSQAYLNTLDFTEKIWDVLDDFINLFSQRWAVPTTVGSAGHAD